MCFRLAQTAVVALNLLYYHTALLLLNDPGYSAAFGTNKLNTLYPRITHNLCKVLTNNYLVI
jgi:hypothetical protein